MIFKKTYTFTIEADLDEYHNDSESIIEDFECGELGDILDQIREDIDDVIAGGNK